jgi:hypothetical protein
VGVAPELGTALAIAAREIRRQRHPPDDRMGPHFVHALGATATSVPGAAERIGG